MDKLKNVAIFVLVAALVTISTVYLVLQNENEQLSMNLRLKEAKDSTSLHQVYSYIFTYGHCVDIPIDANTIVVDTNNTAIKLSNLIKGKRFIYHFDETNCFTCVEKYIPYIKSLSQKIGKANIIILGSYENPRNLFSALKNFDLGEIPVYNMDPQYFENTKIGELNAPFIFEVDSSLKQKRFFIPEKALPELSQLYESITVKNL